MAWPLVTSKKKTFPNLELPLVFCSNTQYLDYISSAIWLTTSLRWTMMVIIIMIGIRGDGGGMQSFQ